MNFYSLQIFVPLGKNREDISRILGVNDNDPEDPGWCYVITDQDWRFDTSIIDHFLSILEGKYDELNKIGVAVDDISIWRLYEYDQQCNMELTPELMLKMGSRGITYCISCWQKDSVMCIEDISDKEE